MKSTYVQASARPENNLLDMGRDDFDPGDLRVPRDLARRMKTKSLFIIREEMENAMRHVFARNPAEAQILAIKLQRIARGMK